MYVSGSTVPLPRTLPGWLLDVRYQRVRKYSGGGDSIPLAVLYYTMVKYVLCTEQSVNDD